MQPLDSTNSLVDGPIGMAKLAVPDIVGVEPSRVEIDVVSPQEPHLVRADAAPPCRVERSKPEDLEGVAASCREVLRG